MTICMPGADARPLTARDLRLPEWQVRPDARFNAKADTYQVCLPLLHREWVRGLGPER